MRQIDTIVIHHSASKSGNVDIFRKEHMAKGWTDVGYHCVICNGHGGYDGQVQVGRPDTAIGAAVFGANIGKLHVCLVGNFEQGDIGYSGKPTERQMTSLGQVICDWQERYGRKFDGRVLGLEGHNEAALKTHPTLCPGNQFPIKTVRNWYFKVVHDYADSLLDRLVEEGFWNG